MFNVLNYVGGITYTESAQRIFKQMAANGSEPNAARKTIINQLVKDLQGNGNHGITNVWQYYDILNVYAAANQAQALTEWIIKDNPGDYDPFEVNNPTFTTDSGYTGQDLISCIDDNFNAAINGTNFTRNNNSFGGYFQAQPVRGYMGGQFTGIRTWARLFNTSTDQANNANFINGNINGDYSNFQFYYNDRAINTSFKIIKNETTQATLNSTTTGLNSLSFAVLGLKTGAASYSNQNVNSCKIWHRGASLINYLTQINGAYTDYLNSL